MSDLESSFSVVWCYVPGDSATTSPVDAADDVRRPEQRSRAARVEDLLGIHKQESLE